MAEELSDEMLSKLKEMKINALKAQTEIMRFREEISDLQLKIMDLYKSETFGKIMELQKHLAQPNNSSTDEPML